MVDYEEFEETTRFSDAELSSVMMDIRARLSGEEEDEDEGATEVVQAHWRDMEPLDSETAAFSLDAPALKSLEPRSERMPHAEPTVSPEPNWARDVAVAAASGTGLALLCVGALWVIAL